MVKNIFLMDQAKKPTIKALRTEARDSRGINLSINGNKKLKNSDQLRFVIWNLPAVRTCPYATEHCKNKCYAVKAETAYPNVKKQRENNFKASLKDDFIENMIFALNVEISRNECDGVKTLVRIHESGDFYNQKYMDAWLAICAAFTGRNVQFMAYTKSIVYLEGRDIPENLFIRFSLWDDTRADQIELAAKYNLPIYTAYTKEIADQLINKGLYSLCRCDDCGTCGQCWNKDYKKLVCHIH